MTKATLATAATLLLLSAFVVAEPQGETGIAMGRVVDSPTDVDLRSRFATGSDAAVKSDAYDALMRTAAQLNKAKEDLGRLNWFDRHFRITEQSRKVNKLEMQYHKGLKAIHGLIGTKSISDEQQALLDDIKRRAEALRDQGAVAEARDTREKRAPDYFVWVVTGAVGVNTALIGLAIQAKRMHW
ncbi:Uncharacterized protein PBTT_02800 [Plasmodiophora brassicae]